MTSHPADISPAAASVLGLAATFAAALAGGYLGARMGRAIQTGQQLRHYQDTLTMGVPAIDMPWQTAAGERELFTTTTPGAYPRGREVTITEGKHQVTRIQDLGTFPDINGQRHQQWRVWGKPVPTDHGHHVSSTVEDR